MIVYVKNRIIISGKCPCGIRIGFLKEEQKKYAKHFKLDLKLNSSEKPYIVLQTI